MFAMHRDRSRSRSPSGRKPLSSSYGNGEKRESGREADTDNQGNTLYVTGLSTRVTDEDLVAHFALEGRVADCRLMTDPRTHESRGFAFITMATSRDAEAALKNLNKSFLDGRTILVERARRARPRTPTPGEYLGVRNVRDVAAMPGGMHLAENVALVAPMGRSGGSRGDYGPPRRSSYYEPERRGGGYDSYASEGGRSVGGRYDMRDDYRAPLAASHRYPEVDLYRDDFREDYRGSARGDYRGEVRGGYRGDYREEYRGEPRGDYRGRGRDAGDYGEYDAPLRERAPAVYRGRY
eukprot:TRINITY_DN23980_c0_g1_i1.p1 TRINITY_DN23980_c0_g1~~TRINITY_DN23980_c0_g1_i1.p1  ORF type:complete len:295 (+),score=27.82 TRINITY_DN23980_c0_g1_i1:110-994(+)